MKNTLEEVADGNDSAFRRPVFQQRKEFFGLHFVTRIPAGSKSVYERESYRLGLLAPVSQRHRDVRNELLERVVNIAPSQRLKGALSIAATSAVYTACVSSTIRRLDSLSLDPSMRLGSERAS